MQLPSSCSKVKKKLISSKLRIIRDIDLMERYKEAFEEVTKKHNQLIEEYKKKKEGNKECISFLSKSVELMFAIIEKHAVDVDETLIKKRSKIVLPEKAAQLVEEKYLKATTVEALKNFLALDLKSREPNTSSDYSSLLVSTVSTQSQSNESDKVLLISKEIEEKNNQLIQYFANLIGGIFDNLPEDLDVQKLIDERRLDGEQKKQKDQQHEELANPLLGICCSSRCRPHAH